MIGFMLFDFITLYTVLFLCIAITVYVVACFYPTQVVLSLLASALSFIGFVWCPIEIDVSHFEAGASESDAFSAMWGRFDNIIEYPVAAQTAACLSPETLASVPTSAPPLSLSRPQHASTMSSSQLTTGKLQVSRVGRRRIPTYKGPSQPPVLSEYSIERRAPKPSPPTPQAMGRSSSSTRSSNTTARTESTVAHATLLSDEVSTTRAAVSSSASGHFSVDASVSDTITSCAPTFVQAQPSILSEYSIERRAPKPSPPTPQVVGRSLSSTKSSNTTARTESTVAQATLLSDEVFTTRAAVSFSTNGHSSVNVAGSVPATGTGFASYAVAAEPKMAQSTLVSDAVSASTTGLSPLLAAPQAVSISKTSERQRPLRQSVQTGCNPPSPLRQCETISDPSVDRKNFGISRPSSTKVPGQSKPYDRRAAIPSASSSIAASSHASSRRGRQPRSSAPTITVNTAIVPGHVKSKVSACARKSSSRQKRRASPDGEDVAPPAPALRKEKQDVVPGHVEISTPTQRKRRAISDDEDDTPPAPASKRAKRVQQQSPPPVRTSRDLQRREKKESNDKIRCLVPVQQRMEIEEIISPGVLSGEVQYYDSQGGSESEEDDDDESSTPYVSPFTPFRAPKKYVAIPGFFGGL
ncbi:hypothetical protein P7C70_g7723, partial [Phenoliferia sp. Uapishka_3]